jgi:hypothetical protein
VLGTLASARLDEERLEIYTHLIRAVASAAARSALEALMTTAFKDEFIDRIKAEGRAEGEVRGRADMLLRVLAARGLEVPATVRVRVLSCTDLSQLDAWGDRAVTATVLDEVFPG